MSLYTPCCRVVGFLVLVKKPLCMSLSLAYILEVVRAPCLFHVCSACMSVCGVLLVKIILFASKQKHNKFNALTLFYFGNNYILLPKFNAHSSFSHSTHRNKNKHNIALNI